MKISIQHYMILSLIFTCQSLIAKVIPTISYPTYQDSPGYNTPVKDHKFDNVEPILFTPLEDIVTGDDSNKNQLGYFWPMKDSDKTLTYPGKARVGNTQYINVVAIDSKKLNTTGDANSAVSTDQEDIYHPTSQEKKLFDDDFLIPIGTFMKPNDPTVYTLLGQYVATLFPDPREVAVTGPDGAVAIVSQ